MANELVVIEKSTALEVFKSSDSVEDIIRKVEQEVNSFIPDVSTAKGRKEIASLAYKVAQSKTYLDGLGKDLVAELKEIPKLIDANRRTVRERFDTLRDKVRQPLTEWEAEQERIRMDAWHEEALEMNAAFDKALAERIESDHEIALLMNEKFDRDLAEAKAEAERQRIAHEEELKKQAAEQARLEAEQKAQQEIEAAAQREREAKEAAERAEREKQEAIQRAEQEAKEAQERAEREKQAAIEAERKKAHDAEQARLAEEERKRQEDAKRQEDKEHRRVFNQEALKALVSNGFDEKLATEFIKLVASNQIPHMTMNY